MMIASLADWLLIHCSAVGIVVAAHGGHDDIVGAIGMLRIELRDGRLRFDLQRRKQRHGAGRRCQRHDIGDVGALEDAVGHQVIGGLGGVVDADDGDQRALPLRRLQRRDHRIALVLRDRRRRCDGRRRRQRENPGAADGDEKRDCAERAPQQTSRISWFADSMLPDRNRVYCRYVLFEMTQIPRKRSCAIEQRMPFACRLMVARFALPPRCLNVIAILRQFARRANQSKSVQPVANQKYSAFVLTQISRITPPVSRRMRGARDRHERAVRCDGR